MSRVLAIDYGRRRIGLAISDEARMFASPLSIIEVPKKGDGITAVVEVANAHHVGLLVIGLPLTNEGDEGDMAQEVREWGERLAAKADLEVIYRDERLSSVWADRVTREAGLKKKKAKSVQDAMAAQAVLDGFLMER